MAITRISPAEYFRQRTERKRLLEPITKTLQEPDRLVTRPLERIFGQEKELLPLGLIIFGTIALIMVGGIILVALRR